MPMRGIGHILSIAIREFDSHSLLQSGDETSSALPKCMLAILAPGHLLNLPTLHTWGVGTGFYSSKV